MPAVPPAIFLPSSPLRYVTDVMPRFSDREAEADVSDLLPRQGKAALSTASVAP
jgi:hypothetical protein